MKRFFDWRGLVGVILVALPLGCNPFRVKVEAPSEPITINLNVKLDADVRVKVEDQAKKDIAKHPDVF